MPTEPLRFPNTQALRCPTFQAPRVCLELGNFTVPELYDWSATHNPEHPLFTFHDGERLQIIKWAEAIRGIHRAAHYVADRVERGITLSTSKRTPTVAILATSETIAYSCLLVGIFRAGFTAFPISPRNGPDAVAHLLAKTNASIFLTSGEPAILSLAATAVKELNSVYHVGIETYPIPVFADLLSSNSSVEFESFPEVKHDLDAPALVLHTSGSTAFPKPIAWTHRSLLQWSLIPWYGDVDFAGVVMGSHSMPMYHGMGAIQLCYAPSCGIVLATFKPRMPPTFPTPENVFEGLMSTRSEYVCCVPTFIEQWSLEPENVDFMKTMRGVIYGGGPLLKEVGNYLTLQGVRIFQTFGLTEAGVVNVFLPAGPTPDWDYCQFSSQIMHDFIPREDGTYELILSADGRWRPRVINLHTGGRDAYATSDLFVPHPTKSDLWKVFGRADEQIMLSTGEKTNPGPLERILVQDPLIQAAVMFGRGHFQNGALIEPKQEHALDRQDAAALERFRNAIWPTIERLNAFAPQHSRLFKEMILVTSPSKPFIYTAKGTPRRQTILAQYDFEINELYVKVEQSAELDIPIPLSWTPEATLDFVRNIVASIMKQPVGDDDDIFQYGCDSLQATWIRNKILKALRGTNLEAARRLPPNFVFRAPSISSLTKLILNAIHTSTPESSRDVRVQELRAMVGKYSKNFPSRPSLLRPRSDSGDVVFLTGTTRGFGCNILAQLSIDPTVAKVYAFNRPSEGLVLRQVENIQEQGLVEECLRSPKFQLIEGDLDQPGFGLKPDVYEQIRDSVTHIIHNAWPVDFNLTLVSFEKNLQGIRNLVDLALSSPHTEPPRVLFMSSIGIFRNPQTRGLIPETPIDDPTVAMDIGYTEAKWLGERILLAATEQTGLPTLSVRMGQLTGDKNGHWKEKEWFPLLVRSAVHIGCLPDVEGSGLVSWIPSYDAAAALVEMRHSSEPILHLVNPNAVPWRTLLEPIAKDLGVPLVPYSTWLRALEDSRKDERISEVEHLRRNPTLHLLNYFKRVRLDDDLEPIGVVRLDTTKARKVAPSLEKVKIGEEHARKWMAAWRKSGFLPASQLNNTFQKEMDEMPIPKL